MSAQSWLRSVKSRLTRHTTPASRSSGRRIGFRPRLEALEDRAVPTATATFSSVMAVQSGFASTRVISYDVDSAGNTYVTGCLRATTDFDPTHSDSSAILTPVGYADAFIVKYGPGGTLDWARQMGSSSDKAPQTSADPIESGWGVAVDGSGNVYVTGQVGATANFGSYQVNSSGSGDAFITKLDQSGKFVWAKSWGGANTLDFGLGIAADTAGNVFSVGFTATIYPGQGWAANGFEVHEYSSSNGTSGWSYRVDAAGGAAGGVTTDGAGNVFLSGNFAGTVNFNPSASKKNAGSSTVAGAPVESSGVGVNAFVMELTSGGAFDWVTPFIAQTKKSPSASVGIGDPVVDPKTGNIALGGRYTGQVDFNPSAATDILPNFSSYDGFVAKLTPTGALAWATPLGGGGVSSVAFDSSGAVYATGSFTQVFTPGFSLPAVTCIGSSDVFVTKLTSTGAVSWALTFGGAAGSASGGGIAVDAAGNIELYGTFTGTVDFNPDPNNTNSLTNSTGYFEMFILLLTQP